MKLLDRGHAARPRAHSDTGEVAGPAARSSVSRRGRAGAFAAFLLPGALTVYLGFSAGGFYLGAPALVALALALLLVLRAAVASNPLAGVSGWLLVAMVPFGLYAAWVLSSSAWSNAPARGLIEFDRALLYLLALVFFGSLLHTPARLRLMLRGLLLAALILCVAGLVTKLLPELWSAETSSGGGLDHPLTYEGALGLVAALGMVFSLHLATSVRQGAAARVAGAVAAPLLATTLLLTLSRASILAVAVGVVAFLVLARARGTLTGLLAAVPATVVAILVAYGEQSLFEPVEMGTEPAGAPGVAVVVALCALGAGFIRLALLPLDARLARRAPARVRRGVVLGMGGVAAAAAVVAAVALGVPQALEQQFEQLVEADPAPLADANDARARLAAGGASVRARLDYWNVALDAFDTAPLRGQGAGTFAIAWARDRPGTEKVEDAHSLYLETLAELGVVGFALLAMALTVIFAGFLRGMRGSQRSVYAALFAAGLTWAVHAAMDWDWEMPAVTLWLFAAGGAALAARPRDEPAFRRPRLGARAAIVSGVLVLALTPVLVALSAYHQGNAEAAATEGDCAEAIDSALSSISVLGVRPQPFETLGYCDLRVGAPELAVRAFESAVLRDPENWRYRYGLAIARGANRMDPRAAAREARRLNPLNPQTTALVKLFDTDDPDKWARRAATAPPATD